MVDRPQACFWTSEHRFHVALGRLQISVRVRIFRPPVEGKLVHGFEGLSVGRKLRVKLISTDVERGFIDFVRSEN